MMKLFEPYHRKQLACEGSESKLDVVRAYDPIGRLALFHAIKEHLHVPVI